MKVKDIVAVLKYCEASVFMVDKDCAEGYRIITFSNFPYHFSPLVLLADVVAVYPEKKNRIMIQIE